MQFELEVVEEAIEDHQGYCTQCQEIVDTFCEPDAEKYLCPECGTNTVMGMENAILLGEVTV